MMQDKAGGAPGLIQMIQQLIASGQPLPPEIAQMLPPELLQGLMQGTQPQVPQGQPAGVPPGLLAQLQQGASV